VKNEESRGSSSTLHSRDAVVNAGCRREIALLRGATGSRRRELH
jgi:hypothetical protein